MTTSVRVLVIDDDRAMTSVLADSLKRHGFDVVQRNDARTVADDIAGLVPDVVVTDARMPGKDGVALCRDLRQRGHRFPIVLLTGFGSMDAAVNALRAGATDFLTKPVDTDELARVLRRLAPTPSGPELLGDSDAMVQLRARIARIGPSQATVLVRGETGTGKELVARALHAASPRAAAPFVALNAGAIPDHLVESELFGHVRGAFTDARTDRAGVFRQAQGGTLFLDEIAELPMSAQTRLLRVLQERKVRPVGADADVPVDVRIVAATHRDLAADVRAGRFREDLFYRIDGIAIAVPPLRERGDDVLLLAQRFVEDAARREGRPVPLLRADAEVMLRTHPWPGNVRELDHAMSAAVVLADDVITPEHLPAFGALPDASIDGVERDHIAAVLASVEGRRTEAADRLGIDRKTLYRKLRRWGMG